MPHDMLYNSIGVGYSVRRQPDPRIAATLHHALGDARNVVNVGAGTGSYEPNDRAVVAVEPSMTMIAQRPEGSAPVICASAESLPFDDGAFDAAMAVLTLHHWIDWRQGLAELRRVAKDRVVLLTWDPASPGFWLVDEYFPDMLAYDRMIFPSIDDICSALGWAQVETLPIPHDCVDGFLGAYWRRPHAYLDPTVRAAISSFSRIGNIEQRLLSLHQDVESGRWANDHSNLLKLNELDVGYRIITAHRN